MINQRLDNIRESKDCSLIHEFQSFVRGSSFPCVGAKSALSRRQMDFNICSRLGSRESAAQLREGLKSFSLRHPTPGLNPVSFVALFRHQCASEMAFHDSLWDQLQAIHDLDVEDYPWAAGVSNDVEAADFSFSVASRAFFVVGLHPHASRLARRAPHPTVVFNLHDQFEALRASGRYKQLQSAIRQRDVNLQGTINPLLAGFGEASEALQYSGLATAGCPFRARNSHF